MPKVYATVPGAEVWIPPHGMATNDSPALVPAAVGAELAKVEGLRVESDEDVTVVTVAPGVYRTAEDLEAALDAAVEKTRAKRPKSEKE
jgi:hypothetical protein